MNEVIQFLQEHSIELVKVAFALATTIISGLLLRKESQINKKLSVIDIDGDGVGDVDPRFQDYYIRCKHCRRYTKLSEATFIKEVKDEEEA